MSSFGIKNVLDEVSCRLVSSFSLGIRSLPSPSSRDLKQDVDRISGDFRFFFSVDSRGALSAEEGDRTVLVVFLLFASFAHFNRSFLLSGFLDDADEAIGRIIVVISFSLSIDR